jgi:hypothetical protein
MDNGESSREDDSVGNGLSNVNHNLEDSAGDEGGYFARCDIAP